MAKKQALELSKLMGNSSRTYQSRKVTADMVASKTHVAIALWDVRWASAENGKLSGWIIVVDSGRGRKQFISTGSTLATNPTPEVITDFLSAVKGVPTPIWVVVGRRQAALGSAIRKLGHKVTGSFVDENRSVVRARNLRKVLESKALRKSKRSGEQPPPQPSKVIAQPTLWLPNRSSFKHSGKMVRIATDASSDTVSKGTMCFVADNGDYQLRTRMTKAGTDELELETITLALKYAYQRGFERAVVETDSVAALDAVDHILAGGKMGKTWRGISPGARSRFLQSWKDFHAQGRGRAKIGRVLGHAGDPLNYAADRIAYLGLRASSHPEAEAAPTAWQEVEHILGQLKSRLTR